MIAEERTDKTPLILTHGGAAHADEYFAIVFLVWWHGWEDYKILRVPHEEVSTYRQEENAYFVDIGGQFDGDRNFDHHQWDPTVPKRSVPKDQREWYKCSAATLVVRSLCPEILEDAQFGANLKRVQTQDTGGLAAVSKGTGVSATMLSSFFLEARVLLKIFRDNPELAVKAGVEMVRENREFHRKKAELVAKGLDYEVSTLSSGLRVLEAIPKIAFSQMELPGIFSLIKAASNKQLRAEDADLLVCTRIGHTCLSVTPIGIKKGVTLRGITLGDSEVVLLNDKNLIVKGVLDLSQL